MLAQRRRRWPIITSALGQCIVLSGKWPFWRRGIEGVTVIAMRQYPSKPGTITQRYFNVRPSSKAVVQH